MPRLRGSAYEGVTIRNLLRMCSGVAWREDYDADARSEHYLLGRAMARRRPGAVLDMICELRDPPVSGDGVGRRQDRIEDDAADAFGVVAHKCLRQVTAI